MKRFRRAGLVMLVLVLLVVSAGYFLVATERGLQLISQLVQSQFTGVVQIGRVDGTLVPAFGVHDLRIQVNDDVYDIARARIDWSLQALLAGEVRVNRLDVDSLTVSITSDDKSSESEFVLDVALPVSISLAEASLTELIIEDAGDTPIRIDRISLSARTAGDQLDIDALQLVMDDLSASLAGTLGLRPDMTSELLVDWSVDSGSVSSTGQASLAGRLAAYTVDATAILSGTDIPAGHWQLAAAGDLQALSVSRITGETLDGTIRGDAVLDWQTGFGWRTALQLHELNPAGHWPGWPGSLSSGLASSGRFQDGELQASLQLQQLDGQLRNYPVRGEASLRFEGGLVELQQLDLQSGDNTFMASGVLDRQWQLAARADLVDLAALLPGWSGSLQFAGDISGERDHPQVKAAVEGADISGPAIGIESLSGEAFVEWSETARQSLDMKFLSASIAGQHYDEASLALSGELHNHQLSLDATGSDGSVNLRLAGDWQTDHWEGEIRTADWHYPAVGAWDLEKPVSAQLGANTVQLPGLCWRQDQAFLCLDARGDPMGQVSSSVRLKSFPLSALGMLSGTQIQASNRVDASVQMDLEAGRLHRADVLVGIGPGHITYDDPTVPTDSHIVRGELRAQLNAAGLTADADLDLAGTDYLRAGLTMPGYQPGITPWESQVLQFDIKGELHDMLFVQYLLEEVGQFDGIMVVDLNGSGTLARPRISGGASISDSTLEIDELGIRLTDLDVQLRSKADGLVVTGNSRSGKGVVWLSGAIDVVDIAHWRADVRLHGQEFEVMHLPESIIEVSPDIRAIISPPALDLSGEIHVPYARLRPKDLETRAGISGDVVIVDEIDVEEPAERWQVTSKLRLSLGDDVTIDGLGLKGDILGAVNLLDTPGKATTAQGKLSIERGTYEVYGRKLDIHRGQLLFSGGPVDNPGLDFEASRSIDQVTAGIRARGSLREPEIKLYSDPAMGESDIISYIAFGKPQAEAGQGGGSVTDAGLLAGGNMLAGVIGTRVGLDEFGVESGETLEEAAMVLGTYLSPQLYVRYRTGLYDAINEFEVRYEFTRRWSVRTITSVETSSAEVQFSFER